MDNCIHPAFRPSGGSAMTSGRTDSSVSEDEDLLTRTSWVNAKVAYRQIEKGRATGNTCALKLRAILQRHLFNLGCFVQRHCGKVLFVGLLVLALCAVGLKTADIEEDLERLWVEDGGRLQTELAYTKKVLGEGSGTTSEIVIQTPSIGSNLLSKESFLLHLNTVLEATKIKVEMFDRTWKFRDLCYMAGFPSFDTPLLDKIVDDVLPCVIITPLDCFWEGSKLLGPDHPIYVPGHSGQIWWTNLNPMKILAGLKTFNFPFSQFEELMNRAGIDSAYQEKPCIDPHDVMCPVTAPNFQTKKVPDIGAELTNGCTGFASKYLRWNEDLIVGGIEKNRTGHIVRVEALQSIIQLMGEREMYNFYRDRYKVHNLEWTQEKAKQILEAWQRKFSQIVSNVINETTAADHDNIYAFSQTSLYDIIKDFSKVSPVRVVLGYVLMLVYACVSLLRWTDPVSSQSGIGMAGVMLVALSVAAGLGICCVLGIEFNAATTQIIPFLALGLGVDDMFLMVHAFGEHTYKKDIPYMEQTGEVLKRTGVSILLTSLCNMFAFFLAAIIPIPALRVFTLQAGILILFNMGSILLVFPAIVSLDLIRRENKHVDVFCCFTGSIANQVIELRPPIPEQSPVFVRRESPPPPYTLHQTITRTDPTGQQPVTVLAPDAVSTISHSPSFQSVPPPSSLPPSASNSRQCLTGDGSPMTCKERCGQAQQECCRWSLTAFAHRIYGPLLEKTPIKILVIVIFSLVFGIGVWGTTQVKDGLDLTDVVPRGTSEYSFLEAQSKYFGFFHFYAVTQGDFDYPNNQELLYKYHRAFQKVDNIIKEKDGTLPDFWLGLFCDWLLGLQKAFDKDVAKNYITKNGWSTNASDDGILGYKLLVQTGDIDSPIDKEQVMTNRLVSKNNIINPNAFYTYLTAWHSNDAMAYDASQALLHPIPKQYYHEPDDHNLLIEKSSLLTYTQLAFYLKDMVDMTEDAVDIIKEIRAICDEFSDQGLPNYPSGYPFMFWEQYINLRFYLMLSLVCILLIIFFTLAVVLINPWAAFVVVIVLSMTVVELFGFMGLAGIKLSAVPAVILIVSVGIGVEFTVHILLGFLTSIGSRDRRMRMALDHMFAPVINGAVSTLLGVIMLVGAEFDFIVRYFFNVLTALVIIGLFNGLVLLPVLLSMLGPQGEVVPMDKSDRIAAPSPEPSPPPPGRPQRSTRRVYPRMPSDLSLSTITEEPTQYSSHEIIVHPEIVVETTTVPGSQSGSSSRSGSRNTTPSSSRQSTPPMRHVTTVKATAKVKVEVQTPLPGAVDQDHKRQRRKCRELEGNSSSSDSSDSSYGKS
ncbi:protein patched homolog 1-like isoform X2 [Lineus longissimus]|uniref:protein patched homolog 1-like isoform X2 n=1 Tax=Lineus longissimus TaxID=88925 RepID=UPI002B4E3719